MSGPQAKPFKARLGVDSNNSQVINVGDPVNLTDAVNVQYLVANNTVQTFDATRSYPSGFIVERLGRLYKSNKALTPNAFDINSWTQIRAFNFWRRIAGAYTAEPGDCLLLNTLASSVTITLPATPAEGDTVYVIDEGTAATNPIILSAGTNTFNNAGVSTYYINSSDTTLLVFLGGTWRVIRTTRPQYQLVNANTTVSPNTFNYVTVSTTPITVVLPIAPVQGQWVVVADGASNSSTYAITINGNGKNINGAATSVINRNGTIASLMFDSVSNEWKAVSASSPSRRVETLTPLVNQSVVVTLDTTNKAMNLPTTSTDGDWVEVITRYQDTVTSGSLVVTATGAGFFRLNGASQNTTTYRIKQRRTTLFIYKAGEWAVIATNDTMGVPVLTTGAMTPNSFVTLVGTAGQTILLPAVDQVRIGDTITAVINSTSASVSVGLQTPANSTLDGGTANLTYLAADTGLLVTYIYRGWNTTGSKYVWESVIHGTPYLKKTSNLSDLVDPVAARGSLSVYSKAEADSKFLQIAGTTAAQSQNTLAVGGVPAAQMAQNTANALVADDPNTTALNLIVTNHINTPNAGATYWYISTVWVSSISNSSARFQFAYQYTGNPAVEFRQYDPSVGAWSDWITISTIIDGSTYNINITGLATSATKLNVPRTINGVAFDGTSNITVADSTKLPTSGGLVTGPISRAATSIKTYDQVLSKSITGSGATVTGTLKITLPVGYNSTMMKMRIGIIDYVTDRSNTDIRIGGYNFSAPSGSTSQWANVSASTNGGPTTAIGQTVRFAFDGTNNCILIGTTASVWNYPAVTISDVNLAYSGASATGWDTGTWDAAIITSESGITVTATASIDPNIAKLDRSSNLFLGEVQQNYINGYRLVQGNYGTFWRNDGTNLYLLTTASGDPYGTYNANRPLNMSLATGAIASGTAWSFTSSVTVTGTLATSATFSSTGTATFTGTTTNSNWWRSTGATGWYNQDYGGGINMQDTTWVRVYGSKAFLVSNDIAATGNVVAYYSDKRLKENLKPIEGALDTVLSWTGYTYNANSLGASFGYDPDKQEIGLLAQDVQATTPQAVERAPFDVSDVKGGSKSGENYLTLKYERLVPVLVEAIKEQNKEIEALKQQVSALIEAMSK